MTAPVEMATKTNVLTTFYIFSETRNMGSLQFRFTGSTHSSPAICAECNVKTTTNLTKVATPLDV